MANCRNPRFPVITILAACILSGSVALVENIAAGAVPPRAKSEARSEARSEAKSETRSDAKSDTGVRGIARDGTSLARGYAQPADLRLARGYAQLTDLRLDKAIAAFTPPLIESANSDLNTENNRQRAALCLELIARALIFDENEPAAAQAADLAAKLDGGNVSAAATLAEALGRAGQSDRADEVCRRLRPLAKTDGPAARALGMQAFRRWSLTEAKGHLEDALRIDPEDNLARSALTRVLNLMGYASLPGRQVEILVDSGPSPYLRELWLSYQYTLEQKGGEVALHTQAALKLNPDDPTCHVQQALILSNRQDQTDAKREFLKATNCARFSTRAFTLCGAHLAFGGDRKAAAQVLAYAEKVRPWASEIALARAKVLEMQKDWPKAEAAYRQCLRMHPYNVQAYNGLRSILTRDNNLKALEVNARSCIRACPTTPQSWQILADFYRRNGDYAGLADACRHALSIAFGPPSALTVQARHELARTHSGLGIGLYKTGRQNDALTQAQDFNTLKRLDTRSPAVDFLLLRPERLKFKLAKPKTKADEAVDHVALADMLYQEHDLVSCCREYARAIELDPNNLDWHMCYFSALIDKNDWPEMVKEDFVLTNKILAKAPQVINEWRKQWSAAKGSAPSKVNELQAPTGL